MKAGGTYTEDPVSKKTVRQGMRAERKMDRQDKRWDKKYEKQKAEELMKSKRMKAGGTTGIVGMPMYGNNPRTQEGRMLKKGGSLPANTTGVKKAYAKGGATASFAPNRAVTASCKNGTVRDASGKCVMQRKMQVGGPAAKPATPATPSVPRDPRMTVSSGASAPQPYNVNTPTYGGKPLTQVEADALNKKARMDRAMGRMQKGGTKRPLRTKEQVYDDPYGKGKYSLGFKSSRTNPITNKTVEKSRITTGSNGRPQTETKTRTVTDRKGNVKQKIKTYDVGPVVKPSTADKYRIKEKYSADKKTKTVTKNGEGFKKTNNYLGRNKKIKLAQDAWRTYSGREKVKVSADDLKKQKVGGATKAAKFAALAPPYNKATAADRIAGAKKNKKK
jgi:hypothetical protein